MNERRFVFHRLRPSTRRAPSWTELDNLSSTFPAIHCNRSPWFSFIYKTPVCIYTFRLILWQCNSIVICKHAIFQCCVVIFPIMFCLSWISIIVYLICIFTEFTRITTTSVFPSSKSTRLRLLTAPTQTLVSIAVPTCVKIWNYMIE